MARSKLFSQTDSPDNNARHHLRCRRVSLASPSLALSLVAVIWLMTFVSGLASVANGQNIEANSKTATDAAPLTRTAERNITGASGSFIARLRQTPFDPRAGEEVNIEVELTEKIEGGFGGADNQFVTGTVVARITTAAGETIANNIETHAEGSPPRAGVYGVHYKFPRQGEYKIAFDVRTQDGRRFEVDFPISIIAAPVNWAFWLGFAALGLISSGATFGYYRLQRNRVNDEHNGRHPTRTAGRKTIPVALVSLALFGLGTAALSYFAPPRERRLTSALPPASAAEDSLATPPTGDSALGGSGATITISKESQLLFSIRTVPAQERSIIGGLRVTGTVQARPDARAVVAPPVSGRIFLESGITTGAAITKGQRVAYVEQVLGAPEQAALEGQRISLRTAALEQQARQAEQNALAQQARTRLAQANRELQRAQNLLEVGAAPRRRVEEANTAVKLAEQEAASAESQVRLATQQAELARASIERVDPTRRFPLLAPVTGIVSNLAAATGQQVEAGAQLLIIVNLSTVFLNAKVFERDLPTVRESRRASYTAPALNSEVYRIGEGGEGRLVAIGQAVDPQTRTVPVIYEVPNPLNRLRDGMFIEITLDTTADKSVLSVPKQAVITEQGRTFVFVFKGGETYERRIVTLGAEGQDFVEVNSGLQTGERVVTEGIYQLRSTQPA